MDLTLVVAVLVGIVSSARITRLIVFDHWPPIEWLRARWDIATEESGWNLLLHCHFCASVWSSLGVLLWGYLVDWNTAWWLVNIWLAVSYLAAYVVTFDGADD